MLQGADPTEEELTFVMKMAGGGFGFRGWGVAGGWRLGAGGGAGAVPKGVGNLVTKA